MTRLRLTLAAALALSVAACGQPAEAPADAPVTTPAAAAPVAATTLAPADALPAIALEAEGLRLVAQTGSTRPIGFGLAKAETVDILNSVHGSAGKASTNAECGAGPVEFVSWDDGLSALFQDGKFVGWSLDGKTAGKVTTMNGIGIGSTRAELTADFAGVTVEETTLGQEFNAGGLIGVLDGAGPGAKVEVLWAGTSCVFR